MPYFSVIIPVYNRPDEVRDLLESLSNQTSYDFEILLVEDGSTLPCRSVANDYSEKLDIHYYYKENEGEVLPEITVWRKRRENISFSLTLIVSFLSPILK